MKYALKDCWCGPAAIQNALRLLGKPVGQKRIADLAGTTDEGTDDEDLIRAIGLLGFRPDVFSTDDKREAWIWLREWPAKGVPLIICVDQWDHWITIVGRSGDRVVIQDPEKAPYNTSQNGTWTPKVESILRRWRASNRTRVEKVEDGEPKGPKWYGVGIHR